MLCIACRWLLECQKAAESSHAMQGLFHTLAALVLPQTAEMIIALFHCLCDSCVSTKDKRGSYNRRLPIMPVFTRDKGQNRANVGMEPGHLAFGRNSRRRRSQDSERHHGPCGHAVHQKSGPQVGSRRVEGVDGGRCRSMEVRAAFQVFWGREHFSKRMAGDTDHACWLRGHSWQACIGMTILEIGTCPRAIVVLATRGWREAVLA